MHNGHFAVFQRERDFLQIHIDGRLPQIGTHQTGNPGQRYLNTIKIPTPPLVGIFLLYKYLYMG